MKKEKVKKETVYVIYEVYEDYDQLEITIHRAFRDFSEAEKHIEFLKCIGKYCDFQKVELV